MNLYSIQERPEIEQVVAFDELCCNLEYSFDSLLSFQQQHFVTVEDLPALALLGTAVPSLLDVGEFLPSFAAQWTVCWL